MFILTCLVSHAETTSQVFESYFEKTFISKKITLTEAKRIRILANAQLSGLNIDTPQQKIVDTHKLLLLLVEFENLFPKESAYFNTKQLLTRFYNQSFKNRTQDAEFQLQDRLLKTLGPVKTIAFLNQYLKNLNEIDHKTYAGYATGMKCDILSLLFATQEYESCLKEVYKLSKENSSLIETHKLNQLRYYYMTSARFLSKADQLLIEIQNFESIKADPVLYNYILSNHKLLKLSADPNKITETTDASIALMKLNLAEYPAIYYNSKRNLSILLFRSNKNDLAIKELNETLEFIKKSEILRNSFDTKINSLLLKLTSDLVTKQKRTTELDDPKLNLVLNNSICTQSLPHNTQLALILKLANYKGEMLNQILNIVEKCQPLVSMQGVESYIKTLSKIAAQVIHNDLDKKTIDSILKDYNNIKNNFYSISLMNLIMMLLSKHHSASI